MNNRRQKKSGDASSHEASGSSTTAHELHDNTHSSTSNKTANGQQSKKSRKTGTSTPPQQIILEKSKRPSMLGRPSYSIQAPGTPWHELDLSEIPFLRHVDFDETPIKKGLTRYRRLFFIVGATLGAIVAFLASRNFQMAQHMSSLMSMMDDGFGMDFPSLDLGMPKEFADMGDGIFSRSREWFKKKDFAVGRELLSEGMSADYPVILIPGIVSTGLESWTVTDDRSASYFRKRLWGTTTMMRTIVFEKDMWVRHLSLDPDTGLDPPGIRVRAAEGLDAASFFAAGYWIWSKVIENMAVLGYDTNNLFLASYDWRLSYYNLEIRDKFFTRLKLKIEINKKLFGKKTVIVAHSMGSSVFFYFMKWVEAEGDFHGNGGPTWCEDHIEAFTSIAGTFLGVPKAMAVMLSGEMRDTVEVPPPAAYLLEKFFSRRERAKLFRTWAGGASMLIKGGEDVWGNSTWAPDDEDGAEDTHGHIYSFRETEADQHDLHEGTVKTNLTATDAHNFLLQHAPTSFQKMMEANYSHGIERDQEKLVANNQDHTKWSNPLEVALPNAPSMKLYCIYGVGKPTERSYWYQKGDYLQEGLIGEQMDAAPCPNSTCGVSRTPPLDFPTARMSWIDNAVNKENALPKVRAGCKMGNGDGTVSLLSLGAMCEGGWNYPHWNPAGIKVITHELKHEPEAMDLRGGESTGDHVDILGARGVNEAILKIAAGKGDQVEKQYFSPIRDFAHRVRWMGDVPGPQT